MIRFWRLNERTVDNLGLACTEEGLFLGRTPLIERRGKRFVVRERIEVERLLKRAYQTEPAVHRLMPGLATVAAALNADDQCLARIAAVHLQIPDLPSEAARDSVEAEDVLIKLADWNPALHPRIGAPPNPGWFASTDGVSEDELPLRIAQNEDKSRATDLAPIAADTPVRLPPGDRIDELGDFLEWLANANGWAARGRYFDELYRDGSLHPLSRTIDNFDASGVATSIKSLDLNAITYKDFSRLIQIEQLYWQVRRIRGFKLGRRPSRRFSHHWPRVEADSP
jgi:hypothetical protein